jgi:hypothetical protein
MDLGKLDHPIVFALAILFVVWGGTAMAGWFFASTKLTGPLGLVKGGVVS